MNKGQIIKIILLFSVALIVAGGTTAYGGETQQKLYAQSRETSKPAELIIGGGSGTGFYYLFGEAVAEMVRRSNPTWSITSSVGETASNIQFIHNGKMQLALVFVELVSEAMKGIGVYKELIQDVKIIVNYTDKHPVQFLLLSDVPINSIKEWKEKKLTLRVNVQKRGAGAEVLNNRLLQAYGITYEDIKSWGGIIRYEGGSASMDLMRDGLLDGSLMTADCPSSSVKELSTSRKLKMLPIDPKIVTELVKKYGYFDYVIKAGTYDWLKRDIQSVAQGSCLVASTKLAPGVVRNIIRAHFEQIEYLRSVHVALKPMTVSDFSDIPIDLIHPEAREYYESRGIKFK